MLPAHAQSVPPGRIAYSVFTSPNGIRVLDTVTGTFFTVPWTGGGVFRNRVNWTPAGDWIVFGGGDGGAGQIYVERPDGTGLRRVTDGSGNLVEPTLSSDGSRIAYDSVGGNAFAINFDGTGKTDLGKNINSLAWSPDGNRLLGSDWAAGGGYNSDLWIYNFGTTVWTKLTSRPSGTAYSWPAWHPGGTIIAAAFYTNSQWDIVKMNADGTSMVNLTGDWTSGESAPHWSSDGQYILFSSTRSGNSDIWAMKPDGTGRTNLTLTTGLDESYPAMAPLSPTSISLTYLLASQRSGVGAVDVHYTLASTSSGASTVSIQVSTNGGATFNISPAAGALSGDVGAGISLGSRKLTWDAAQNLSASYSGNNVKVRLTATGSLGTATRTSSSFIVDLAGLTRSIAVNGRVLNSQTRDALSGATVTLAGQTTSTGADGKFSFPSIALASGSTLTVSKSGFATFTGTAPVKAGTAVATVSDVLLQAASLGSQPIVTKVEPRLKGIFLSGASLNNEFTASVNWNGVTPGSVLFLANGTLVAQVNGAGPEYTATLDMGGSAFQPGFNLAGNVIAVQAVGSGGQTSFTYNVYVSILPIPDPIKAITGDGFPFTTYFEGHVSLDFDLPKPTLNTVLNLPVLGKFGVEVAANGSFDYTVTDGEWEAAIGVGAEGTRGKRGQRPSIVGLTRSPKMKLYVGNKEISGKIEAGVRGTATFQSGITFDEVFGHGEIKEKLELGRFGLLDLMGPGLSSSVGAIPGLSDATKAVSVIIYVIPGIEGDIVFALDPKFAFDSVELTGKVGLDAAYEPDLGVAEMRLYVGGEPSVTIGYPGDLFRKVRFKAYAGAEFEVWFLTIGPIEYVFCDVSYPAQARAATPGAIALADGSSTEVRRFKVVSKHGEGIHVRSRDYLEGGPERFVAAESRLVRGKSGKVSTMEDFRWMGQGAKGVAQGKQMYPTANEPQNGPLPASLDQIDLALVENVFPGSDPAMASRTNELMLLYVGDNGSSNTLQCTDIRWTRYDGANWSTPATIHTNTQAEFAPQVAYDGSGNAIAVWERVADPNFNQPDLSAMAAQMEVVWSKWDHTSGQWSVPLPLTANDSLDHAPLICGPMSNGIVLAMWTANMSDLLMGTNGAGSQVLWAEWNPGSQSWSAVQTLLADLPYRLSQSLSGVSNLAVYAWTRDLDGVLTNANDQQVFYCAWSNGVWGAATQFTTNTVGNRNARVSVGPNRHSYLVWQSGTNLVLSRDFSANATMVRADSQTAGFADYAMTIGPGGNLALLWQEMSQAGSDAHYRVLDSASASWSKDALLFNDLPLERSFAPVWDDVGNLTMAYNKVQIVYTNKTVTLEGGGTVTVTNVPQPGRVDLCVTKRQLIKDVTLAAGDFSSSAENYLPGAAVTLSATLRNVGDLAVSNAVVAFYDGNPTNSGVLIANIAISGWLEGAATNTVSALWVVPEPATNHTLYAVADPAGALTEFDEANNRLSLSIGGTDLAVSLVSQTAETNGAVRVIAQVQNLGAPSATNSLLAIRRAGNTNAPLATVAVPLLEPGRLAQVALDLPASTQPEGEQVYTLRADETFVTSDVDTNNNTSSFAVNLWIDSDGDGMSDSWMRQYFGHATGQVNDMSRAQDDADGDGVSNLAEYLAGTIPNNPSSYLRMTGIGSGGTNGVVVAWGSATNKLYSLQRTTSLLLPFADVAQHILSTPPENSYVDATASNGAAFFYRVRVE